MDGLSAAASVVAILQATQVVADYGISFYKAKEEREKLVRELQDLQFTIERLHDRRQGAQPGERWCQGFDRLTKQSGTVTREGKYLEPAHGKPEGPLAQVYQTIASLSAELTSSQPSRHLKRLGERLTWYWDKDKFENMLAKIKNAQESITFILNQDHWDLSRDTNAKIIEGFARFDDRFTTVEESLRKQQDKERRQEETLERETIERWLSPLDFLARQEQLSEDRFMTYKWLLDDPTFQQWTTGKPWHLRCYGLPGSGKTIFSSFVVNHLQKEVQTSNIPVICLYLDHKDAMRQNRVNLLGGLLKQLIQLRRSEPLSTEITIYHQKAHSRQPLFSEIYRLLREEIATYERVFLVVDALDACPFRQELVRYLREIRPENLSVMITSRRLDGESPAKVIDCDYCAAKDQKIYFHCEIDDVDLCRSCKEGNNTCTKSNHDLYERYDMVEIEILTPDDEIERYVKWDIEKEVGYGSELWDDRIHGSRPDSTRFGRRLVKNPDILRRIPKAIVEKAQGQILDAKLCMVDLKSQQTLKGIEKSLAGLPKTYSDHYDSAIQRIKDQKDAEARATGLKALSYVVYAHRVLSLSELQHALATDPGDTEFDADKDYDGGDIVDTTTALVSIDGDLNAVRVHATLQEYLSSSEVRNKWFPTAEIDLATTCLTYLTFDALAKRSRSDEEFEAKRLDYPFLAYASQYWGDHVRDAGPEFDTELAVELISDPQRVETYIQAAWYTDRTSAISWDVRKGVFDLHVCAWFGLSSIIPSLEQEDLEIDIQESTYGQTPLMYACRRGHVEVAQELLKLGASINQTSLRGRTAMFEAVVENHERVVELLLTREDLDVNVTQSKEDDRTALMLAARLNHTNIVARLLKHPKINVNQQDSHGWTALSIATYKGFSATVQQLLENSKTDVNLVLESGHSPLMLAAMVDNSALADRLLQKNADHTLKEIYSGATAMLLAGENNSVSVMRVMLQYGVDLKCLDDDGRGLLHRASESGRDEMLGFLNEDSLDINARDANGLTPLHYASCKGHQHVVEVLLQLGADATISDNFDRTPLKVAWQYGHINITNVFQTEDESSRRIPTPLPDDQELPIWSLAKLGLTDLLSQALSTTHDVLSETEPGTKNTALHWAVIENRLEALRILFHKSHSPDPPNRYQRTPLHLAAVLGNISATQELLVHHASIDLQDRWGETAFYIAQRNMHYPVALALVEAGSAVDIPQNDIQKLLFAAVELGYVNALRILLSNGADVLDHNPEGLTALQLAKEAGDGEMIRVLVSSKSFSYPVTGRSSEGETPMQEAEREGGFVLPFRAKH